jgi:hypothetical protein
MLGVHEQDVDFAAKKLLASNTTAASVLDNRRPQVPFGFTEGFKKTGRDAEIHFERLAVTDTDSRLAAAEPADEDDRYACRRLRQPPQRRT